MNAQKTGSALPIISLVAAVARNGVIGRAGGLAWTDPADLKHFRTITQGHAVLMGRKTWDSLPPRFRPLPGRRNVVVSRQPGLRLDGAEVCTSLDEALSTLAKEGRVFVIGGGQLYAQALPLADELVLTEVDADLEGDTYFPVIDRRVWEVAESQTPGHPSQPGFAFVTYRRAASAAATS